MVRIEDWSVSYDEIDAYTPPELIKVRLSGAVYNHPWHEDGKVVITSSIKEAELKEGGWAITNSGSHYTLGRESEEYKNWRKIHSSLS